MTILIYIPDIDITSGGTTAYVKALSECFKGQNKINIITSHSKNEIKINNSHIHYIKKNISGLFEAIKTINKISPTIIHINTCWLPMSSLITFFAFRKNISILYSTHGMLEPWIIQRHKYTRKLPAMFLYQRRALNNSDCIIATSEEEKKHIEQLGIKSNIKVIPIGINIRKYLIKKSWRKKKKILFLSRIHVKKGIEILLNAVEILKDKLSDYNVIIAGDGAASYKHKLKNMVNTKALNDIVIFKGGVYGEEKIKLLQQADILILPTYSENFGIVVIEALSCGTPVITTTGTPWKELNDRNCGWWVPPTTEEIAKALIDYTKKTDEELTIMGKNGRKLVEEKYTAEIMAKKTLALYKEIIARKINDDR